MPACVLRSCLHILAFLSMESEELQEMLNKLERNRLPLVQTTLLSRYMFSPTIGISYTSFAPCRSTLTVHSTHRPFLKIFITSPHSLDGTLQVSLSDHFTLNLMEGRVQFMIP